MSKLILMAVLVATIAIPFITASDPNLMRGIRRLSLLFVVFVLLWGIACIVIYPRTL